MEQTEENLKLVCQALSKAGIEYEKAQAVIWYLFMEAKVKHDFERKD